jgi:hypothetical protein
MLMIMRSEKLSNIINFSPGRVVYEEFTLDDKKTWVEQIDQLNEDLLQVEFPGDIVLDVGWYPAFNHKGQFQVRVIRDYNWDAPIFYAEVTKMDVLRSVVDAARQTATEAALVTA